MPGKPPIKSPKKRLRTPQRCTKCENRPLRSQCIHTSSGQGFLAAKAHKQSEKALYHTPPRRSNRSLQSHPSTVALRPLYDGQSAASAVGEELSPSGRHCNICSGRPLRSQCKHTSKGKTYLAAESAKKVVDDLISSPPVMISDLFFDEERTDQFSDEPALPMLSDTQDDDAGIATTVFSSPSAFAASTQRTTPVTVSFNNANKRVKATGSNPVYGHVAGVKRGNHPYNIYRTKPLPEVIETSGKASQRFARLTNKLIEKCESLSRETGAWIFFGAQHTSARGGALSYASPRICREAQVEVGELATSFNSIVSSMLRARRTDALALQKRLEKAIADRERAETVAKRGEEELACYREQYGELNV